MKKPASGRGGGQEPNQRRGHGVRDGKIKRATSGGGGDGGGDALGHPHAQDAVGELRGERTVVELAAEAEAELVIALGVLEVGGGEVDPHDVALASDDHEVGAADDDLDSGRFDSGEEDGEIDGVAELLAVVVRAAGLAKGGNGAARTTAVGQRGRKDRVHGRTEKRKR